MEVPLYHCTKVPFNPFGNITHYYIHTRAYIIILGNKFVFFTKWYNGTMVQWYLCNFMQKLTNLSFVNYICVSHTECSCHAFFVY